MNPLHFGHFLRKRPKKDVDEVQSDVKASHVPPDMTAEMLVTLAKHLGLEFVLYDGRKIVNSRGPIELREIKKEDIT